MCMRLWAAAIAVLVPENLHRDVAPEIVIAAFEDDAHTAATDLAQDLVAAPVRS